MSFVRDIVVLGLKELRVLFRDRQAAALLFVMPAIFVFLLSLAVGDLYDAKTSARLKIALTVDDEGEHAQRFVEHFTSRDEIEIVELPPGIGTGEAFQQEVVRALVRVPAGFSARIDEMIESGSLDEGLGEARIQWAVSPRADAINHAIVRASTMLSCVRVLQDKLAGGTQRLAEGVTEMRGRLAEMVVVIERLVGQAQSAKQQFEGSDEQRRAFAEAMAADSRMAREAEAARQALAESGDGGALVSRTTEGEGVTAEIEPVGVDPDDLEIFSPEEQAQIDRLLSEADAPPPQMLQTGDRELVESDLIDMAKNEEGEVVIPNPVQQNVPGWTLFAMFFIVVPLSSLLHRERVEGTSRRLLAMGVPRGRILLGKLWPFVLVGVMQFVAMVLVGRYLVPLLAKGVSLELGPNPVTLVPLTLVAAFAATAYSLLVATLSRTAEQAAAFGASSVVILAALGGVMIPHFMMPPALQTLAQGSPLYWGHQAYLDVFLHGASVQDIAPALGILGGMGALCLALGARRVVA